MYMDQSIQTTFMSVVYSYCCCHNVFGSVMMESGVREKEMAERVIFVYSLWVVHSTMDTFYYGLLYGPLLQCFNQAIVNILILWTVLWQTLQLLKHNVYGLYRHLLCQQSILLLSSQCIQTGQSICGRKGRESSREKKQFFILYEQPIELWVALVMDCSMNYLHSVSAS